MKCCRKTNANEKPILRKMVFHPGKVDGMIALGFGSPLPPGKRGDIALT
jgi:hypothetical protein